MPEGDTIFRLAHDLSPLMTGGVIERASGRAALLSRLEGTVIVSVTSRGKHLLVGVAPEAAERQAKLFVRTHLGLHGVWQRICRAKMGPGLLVLVDRRLDPDL